MCASDLPVRQKLLRRLERRGSVDGDWPGVPEASGLPRGSTFGIAPDATALTLRRVGQQFASKQREGGSRPARRTCGAASGPVRTSGVILLLEVLSKNRRTVEGGGEVLWRTSWQNGQEFPSSGGDPCASWPAIVAGVPCLNETSG